MASSSGPVIVGTSMLDSKGQVKRAGGAATPKTAGELNPSDPRIQLLQTLGTLAGKVASPQQGTAQQLPNFIAPNAPSTMSADTLSSMSQFPPGGAPGGNSAGVGGGSLFQRMLTQAGRYLGPFNSAPYDSQIAALEAQAGNSRTQAKQLAGRAEADDATLYGHLQNFVNMLQHQTGRADNRALGVTRNQYDNTHQQINDLFNNAIGSVSTTDKARGITPELGQLQTSAANANSNILSDRAGSLANERTLKSGTLNNFRQMRSDVAATGTGKVAEQKAALNTALEGIASSLTGQLGSITANESQAQNSYQENLRKEALSLLGQHQAGNPNSLANRIKEEELLKLEKSNNATGTTSSGSIKPGTHGEANAMDSLTTANTQLLPDRQGTLQNLFQELLTGSGPFVDSAKYALSGIKSDPSELGNIMKALIANLPKNYGVPAQQALLRAILIDQGMY